MTNRPGAAIYSLLIYTICFHRELCRRAEVRERDGVFVNRDLEERRDEVEARKASSDARLVGESVELANAADRVERLVVDGGAHAFIYIFSIINNQRAREG